MFLEIANIEHLNKHHMFPYFQQNASLIRLFLIDLLRIDKRETYDNAS